MRHWRRVGCVLLGASVLACGGSRAAAPLVEETPVAVSSGAGGAGEVDPGKWPAVVRTEKTAREQRELYSQVAKELGLEEELAAASGQPLRPGEAVGGGGRADGERRGCAEVLATHEPAAVVSGRLDFAGDGLLILSVPGQGEVRLHADESTCAVQARLERPFESLQEGTEVRASYVMKQGLPTARVVRAEPVRTMK